MVTPVSHYSLTELVNAMTRIQKKKLSIIPFAISSSWKDDPSASYYMELDGIVRGMHDEVVRGIMNPSTLKEHPSISYYPSISHYPVVNQMDAL